MIENLPTHVSIVFILTALTTILIFFRAAHFSKFTTGIITLWMLAQGVVGNSGFYTLTNTLPPRFALLVAPPLVVIVILFLTTQGKKFIDALDIKVLTWLHIVRIPVEVVLLWLFQNGQIPQLMTFEGRNFDILSGLTAPLVAYFGFNMQILGHDIAPNPHAEALGVKFVSLDELLSQSDFVSLNCALTPQNRGLIGEAQFKKMKPNSYLINTARGALVDEAALVRALEQKTIAGAAVDAFTTEPLPNDHPLRRCPNVLLTPHQAFNGRETGERVSLAAAQAIVDLMHGKKPTHVVNGDVFQSSALRAKVK